MEHLPEARGHLLVIDGTEQAGALIRLLEQDGFDCAQARGPIRVRSLLEEQPVDLIVWREEPGNNDLIRDILQECSRFPEIPIIHLFDRVIPSPSVVKHPQIRESLPADSAAARILTLLNRFFQRTEPKEPASVTLRTELAFRNVVSTVLQHRHESVRGVTGSRSEIHAPLTSVNVAERETLSPESSAALQFPPAGWFARLWSWLRSSE